MNNLCSRIIDIPLTSFSCSLFKTKLFADFSSWAFYNSKVIPNQGFLRHIANIYQTTCYMIISSMRSNFICYTGSNINKTDADMQNILPISRYLIYRYIICATLFLTVLLPLGKNCIVQ